MLNAADVHALPQMQTVDDIVLPSKLGGILASGKLMIVAAGPGTELAEFLQDAAILILPDNPEEMANALLGALNPVYADERSVARLGLATEIEREVLLSKFYQILVRCAVENVYCGASVAGVK